MKKTGESSPWNQSVKLAFWGKVIIRTQEIRNYCYLRKDSEKKVRGTNERDKGRKRKSENIKILK